jgi:hypothetical protein
MSWWPPAADDFRLGLAATVAFDAFKSCGRAQRQAAILCQVGDALMFTRPRGWADRSRRAYLGAIRRLDRGALSAVAFHDAASVAHAVLWEARRPYRRLAAVLARMGALGFAGLAALALLASAVSPAARAALFPPDLGAVASWTASSADSGTVASGKPTRSKAGFFMHTQSQDRPWLLITLPRLAKVREVRIWNRGDCCQERTIPLNVEVPDGNDWRLICQRRSPFSSWACHPKSPELTRQVRIEIPQTAILHLQRVAIYE